MPRKVCLRNGNTQSSPTKGEETGVYSPEVAKVLQKIDALLEENRLEEALNFIARSKLKSPWITNAVAVCQLRLGNAKQAVALFHGLVVHSGVLLKPDAPTVFKTNFAAALLASGEVLGCLGVLNELHEEENPAVQRLRQAILGWKQSLSFWERLKWRLGDVPHRTVELDFAPGEIA